MTGWDSVSAGFLLFTIFISMQLTVKLLREFIKEALEPDIQEQIDELRTLPEYKTVEAFIEDRLDEENYEFTFLDLQALAFNLTAKKLRLPMSQVSEPDTAIVASVKNQLIELGFKFVPRKVVKNVRGVSSNPHGTHPFAGSGGGGSGFGSDRSGPSFTSFGGGPGAIGGGYKWDANDPKNLAMNAKRRKNEQLDRIVVEKFGDPIGKITDSDNEGVPSSTIKKDMGNRGFGTNRDEREQVKEEAPPGMEKTVKALKKSKKVKNPWAVAWSIYNKKD